MLQKMQYIILKDPFRDNMSSRLYRIICLKRTDPNEILSNPVYWRPNRAGYTSKLSEAGLYTGLELEDCAGCRWDWLIEPVENSIRFGKFRVTEEDIDWIDLEAGI